MSFKTIPLRRGFNDIEIFYNLCQQHNAVICGGYARYCASPMCPKKEGDSITITAGGKKVILTKKDRERINELIKADCVNNKEIELKENTNIAEQQKHPTDKAIPFERIVSQPPYDILVIDPPWDKRKGGLRKARPNQNRLLNYKTLPTKEIFKLLDEQIFPLASEIHTVFIWTIDEFLRECEDEMEKRNYRRHARMIWDKQNGIAPAFTIRYTHEYLLWYYKPKMLKVAENMRGKFADLFSERAREHSRKPDIAYEIIDKLYPKMSKIDVFSREPRTAFAQFGDQPNYYKRSG